MLMQVLAPKTNEPFEVRPDVARKLVIQHGWSMPSSSPAAASAVPPPRPVGRPATQPVAAVNEQNTVEVAPKAEPEREPVNHQQTVPPTNTPANVQPANAQH